MADFDDDLLALAGDESEGEEQGTQASDLEGSRSPSPPTARSQSPRNSPPPASIDDRSSKAPARRGVASKATSKSTTQRRKVDVSEEEGEA
jgi:hypothetical protein